jgi:cytochrome P450
VHGLPKLAYLPFGGGPRTCIGNGFAMLGLMITTAAVARRVHFELDDHVPEPPRVSFMLRPRGGVRLRVRRLHEQVAAEEACA